jgi:hypothetical protein
MAPTLILIFLLLFAVVKVAKEYDQRTLLLNLHSIVFDDSNRCKSLFPLCFETTPAALLRLKEDSIYMLLHANNAVWYKLQNILDGNIQRRRKQRYPTAFLG